MPTQIDGSTGVSKVQDGVVVQADLGPNVAGNGPVFRAWANIAQSITSAFVKLLFQVEDFDVGGGFDLPNSKFQPNVAGYYLIRASMRMATASNPISCLVYKNGALYEYSATSVGSLISSVSLVYLNGTTDYVEIYGYSQATANTVATTSTEVAVSGCLVRAA